MISVLDKVKVMRMSDMRCAPRHWEQRSAGRGLTVGGGGGGGQLTLKQQGSSNPQISSAARPTY